MAEESYLGMSAGRVRIKIVHVVEARPEMAVTKKELEQFPTLVDALKTSREKSSAKFYPREFEALNPPPTVAELEEEEAKKFLHLVKQRTGASLYEKSVKIAFDDDVYIVAVEHHCG